MCKENDIDITEIEPTEEIMKLWSLNPKYSREEIEYVKCKDGEIRPFDFKNWSKDLLNDYSIRPKSPIDECHCGGWFDYREYTKCGIIKKMVDYYGDMMYDDILYYLKRAKEVNGLFYVKQLLGTSSDATTSAYLNRQRKLPVCCIQEMFHDVFSNIDFYSPKGLVTECDAGDALLFIQRWYYRFLKEYCND